MSADTPLITTISLGLCLAFILGISANKLKISPIVGYLLAGIIVGPYTGGFYADAELTHQLAEFGVILLMFGIGLHFSWKDLLSVKKIAIPGAIAQIAISTILGTLLGLIMRWSFGASFVFGLALSTASTVVVLRNLQERHFLDSERGRIAVGWLVVEDIAMVLALVLVPAITNSLNETAPSQHLCITSLILFTILKIALFITATLLIGRIIIPWLLAITAKTGSRELFRLSVLAIALGVAFIASTLFGVSLALGAFFAGMIMGETDLSQQAAEESLPLRDAFAVLFFVSVGMLFNPFTIVHSFFPLILTLLVVLVGNSAAAYAIMRLFRYNYKTAITIACCVSQIGEFAFILADLANNVHLISNLARDLIVGAAIISIIINPLIFIIGDKIKKHLEKNQINEQLEKDIITIEEEPDENILPKIDFSDHTIIIGFGAIGSILYHRLTAQNYKIVIIDDSSKSFSLENIKEDNVVFIRGNGVKKEILEAAQISKAKNLIISVPHTFEAGQIIITAKELNNNLYIITNANTQSETVYFLDIGAHKVITNADLIANKIIDVVNHPETCQNKSLTKN